MTMTNDKRFTETELARRWQITTRTLQKWRRNEKGPAFLLIGEHTVLYREEDIRAYELSNLQGGQGQENANA
jgi:hypothetical protein